MPALKAFIVEDSPVILENLIATLEELAQVEVVGSVADEAGAVRWMKRDPDANADLFIVDVFLRSGTGLGVLQAAQQLGVRARRVVLTNYATEEMRRRCASLGAERVFDKSPRTRRPDQLLRRTGRAQLGSAPCSRDPLNSLPCCVISTPGWRAPAATAAWLSGLRRLPLQPSWGSARPRSGEPTRPCARARPATSRATTACACANC